MTWQLRAAYGALVIFLFAGVSSCRTRTEAMDDAGSTDVGSVLDAADSGRVCTSDSACDDGVYCNGEERCVAARCTSVARVCDDQIACTADTCSEERSSCVFSAPDVDQDGYKTASCLDATGSPLGNDCDDGDANRFPGNREVCDGTHDEDCDLSTIGETDVDGDRYGARECCNTQLNGTMLCGVDCDDARRGVNPNSPEVCNQLDDDCDGRVDEGVSQTVFPDRDFDGHGRSDRVGAEQRCQDTVGWSVHDDDCDDSNPSKHGGQLEICDLADNDCDNRIDEQHNDVEWFRDDDGDGFGSRTSGVLVQCEPPSVPGASYSILGSDCNDNAQGGTTISVAATEVCDGRDNNCNGLADYVLGINDFEDDDADGVPDLSCPGLGADCNDRDPAAGSPNSEELCDSRDNDCDTRVDEGAMGVVWFLDGDRDGYGNNAADTIVACAMPSGRVARGGDCLDTNVAVRPGGVEQCNGLDDNCNGAVDDGDANTVVLSANVLGAVCGNGAPRIFSCQPGFRDCDAEFASGCEIDVRSNSAHCGACGNICTGANTTSATCTSGQCSFACGQNFGDCDGNPANGCETALLTDANHCGQCNARVSNPPNATAICSGGRPSIVGCRAGYADCDGTFDSGCEINLATERDHCGLCGRSCSGRSNSSDGTCTDGQCTLSCTSGFSNCDGALSNGCEVAGACSPCASGLGDCDNDPAHTCETQLSMSNMHCGACGQSCGDQVNVASGNCVSSRCVLTCLAGFGDCDGLAANGCETRIDVDATHCGTCANACAPAANENVACVSSSCQHTCVGGFGDCQPTAPGCETSLLSSAQNCGACGNACGTAGTSSATCAGGTCSISCSSGRANCDALSVNGCEVTLANDPLNCGFCGNRCDGNHTSSVSCSNSVCQMVCVSGYADCNASPLDGCETDLNLEGNCGQCGRNCTQLGTAQHAASMTCSGGASGGTCAVVSCSAGYGDCNGNGLDGCEQTLASATQCGDTCAAFSNCTDDYRNASGICTTAGSSRMCALGVCNANYGNCDALASNGCEIDLLSGTSVGTRVDNCGGCGAGFTCSQSAAQHRRGSCANGTCALGACLTGYGDVTGDAACEVVCGTNYADCDGDPQNGCETPLIAAPNCGACGVVCGPAGTCAPNGFGAYACDAIAEVSVGRAHTCYRRASGRVACVGDNALYQLGSMGMMSSTTPLEVVFPSSPSVPVITDITVGDDFSCAIGVVSGGALQMYCWGANNWSQLGQGNTTVYSTPQLVSPASFFAGASFASMDAGANHICTYLSNGFTYCWGRNQFGEAGIGVGGAPPSYPLPTRTMELGYPALTFIQQMALGEGYTCSRGRDASNNYKIICSGDNAYRILGSSFAGTSSNTARVVMTCPTAGTNCVGAMIGGRRHACYRDATQNNMTQLFCWGANASGELGRGTSGGVPIAVPAVATEFAWVRDFNAGAEHTCVQIGPSNEVLCSGRNDQGQLGNNVTTPVITAATLVQTPGSGPLIATQLAHGHAASHMATTAISDYQIFSWGRSVEGQLGQGTGTVANPQRTALRMIGVP